VSGGAKRKKQAQPSVWTSDELNKWFYQGYDPGFLFHKAQAMTFVMGNLRLFGQWRQQHSTEDDAWLWDPSYQFTPALKSELFFTAMHQFESFLALLLANFQVRPHWLYLTEYGPGEMREKAQRLVSGELDVLTNGHCANQRVFVEKAVYGEHEAPDETIRGRWTENLDNVFWLIERMARFYLDGLDAYNSYKHGTRIVASNITQFTTWGLQIVADDGLAYLQVQDGKVDEVSREIFPDEAVYFLATMYRMQQTIRDTRLSTYEPIPPRINVFLDIPREQLDKWVKPREYHHPR
jgi:hypothetical protein